MGGLNASPKRHCFSPTRNGCALWTCKPGAIPDGTKTSGLKTHPCQPYEYDNLAGHLKGALGFLASREKSTAPLRREESALWVDQGRRAWGHFLDHWGRE